MDNLQILTGDCRATLPGIPSISIDCCVTSPPYFGLRDYGCDGQIGLEQTPDEYVQQLVNVFREVKHILKDEGTLWVNLGDSYAASRSYQVTDNKHTDVGNKIGHTLPLGLKQKDLIGIPWKVAFALQADGWYLRQDIIWSKPNPMPESVRDRCTKSHEYIFLLSKSKKYFYDHEAIKEPAKSLSSDSKNRWDKEFVIPGQSSQKRPSRKRGSFDGKTGDAAFRAVWNVATRLYGEAHFATYPPELIEPCIFAGCPVGGTVLDPFGGSGTTAGVALAHDRKAILCELNPEYTELIEGRIADIERYYVAKGRDQLDFFEELL